MPVGSVQYLGAGGGSARRRYGECRTHAKHALQHALAAPGCGASRIWNDCPCRLQPVIMIRLPTTYLSTNQPKLSRSTVWMHANSDTMLLQSGQLPHPFRYASASCTWRSMPLDCFLALNASRRNRASISLIQSQQRFINSTQPHWHFCFCSFATILCSMQRISYLLLAARTVD